MSNFIEHQLPELELATNQVREALQCILHTILFIRAPGPVIPQDVHCCEGLDLTYTRIASSSSSLDNSGSNRQLSSSSHNNNKNSNVDLQVNNAIEDFLKNLSQVGPELLQGNLTLSFFERRATTTNPAQKLFQFLTSPLISGGGSSDNHNNNKNSGKNKNSSNGNNNSGSNNNSNNSLHSSHDGKLIWEQWSFKVVVNTTPRPVNDDYLPSKIERQRIQDTAETMLKACLFHIYDVAGREMNHIPPVMYEFEIQSSKGKAQEDNKRENIYSRVANMPPMINLSS